MDKAIKAKLDDFFSQFHSFHSYKKGETILRADDTPAGVFLIKKGFARLYSISLDGREITFNIFKPGSYFPMMWAIGNTINGYFLEAMTEVEVYRAPKDQLVTFIKERPEILFELTKRILVGINGLLGIMEYLLFGNAYMKVATVILTSAKRFGERKTNGDIIIQLPLTHKNIASLAGLTRETTTLEIEKLKKSEIITYKDRLLVVKNLAKLEEELSFSQENKSFPDTL